MSDITPSGSAWLFRMDTELTQSSHGTAVPANFVIAFVEGDHFYMA